MKRKTIAFLVLPVLVIAALTVAHWLLWRDDDAGAGSDGGNAEATQAMGKLSAEVKKRPEAVLGPDNIYRITDPEVIDAIHFCRDTRQLEAIPSLVALADAVDRTLADRPPWNREMSGDHPSPELLLPAANALVVIGEPAVPELLEALEAKGSSGYPRSYYLCQVLAGIVGFDKAVSMISQRIRSTDDQAVAARLREHLKGLKSGSSLCVFAEDQPFKKRRSVTGKETGGE